MSQFEKGFGGEANPSEEEAVNFRQGGDKGSEKKGEKREGRKGLFGRVLKAMTMGATVLALQACVEKEKGDPPVDQGPVAKQVEDMGGNDINEEIERLRVLEGQAQNIEDMTERIKELEQLLMKQLEKEIGSLEAEVGSQSLGGGESESVSSNEENLGEMNEGLKRRLEIAELSNILSSFDSRLTLAGASRMYTKDHLGVNVDGRYIGVIRLTDWSNMDELREGVAGLLRERNQPDMMDMADNLMNPMVEDSVPVENRARFTEEQVKVSRDAEGLIKKWGGSLNLDEGVINVGRVEILFRDNTETVEVSTSGRSTLIVKFTDIGVEGATIMEFKNGASHKTYRVN